MSLDGFKRTLVERLRSELFYDDEGSEYDKAWRRGWNARARSLLVELTPLAERERRDEDEERSGLSHLFDHGGES
jgi:hypothetical protein